ncbi:MAG: HEAT repeat domain-containing protein [Gemmatimonadota bacterium]
MSRVMRVARMGLVLAAAPAAVSAQAVERLVAGAGEGTVQFHFAAREGVCGNGHNFYRATDVGSYMSYSSSGGDDTCAKGPVRAVIVRAGREIVRIETYAGPLSNEPDGGRDLGAVSSRDAASYLIGLAGSLEGRPARDAMQPAMLADSAVVTPQLLRIVGDPTRSRDIRTSAISWLSRRRAEAGGVGAATVQRTLDGLVRDRNESEQLRRQALSTLGSLDRGEGVPLLIAFATDADTWIAKSAFSSLINSGDPRARQFVRDAVKRNDVPEDRRADAIRGIGNEYAVPSDFKLLRDLYPSVNSDQERNAIINTLANAGGTENTNWLLTVATSSTEPASRRRQAVSALSRSDDPRVKERLKGIIEH